MKSNVLKSAIVAVAVLVIAVVGIHFWQKSQTPPDNTQISDSEIRDQIPETTKNTQPIQIWFEFAKQAKTEAECEQIPPSEEVKSNCYLFVAKIKKDISLCDKAGTWRALCRSEISELITAYSESEAKAIISSRTLEVISAMKNNDFLKLSTYVHLQKGVRFSPYSYVSTQGDLVFTADKIRNGATDQTKYVWGTYDGSGFPIEQTFQQYFKSFVYSHDFANAKEVSYNRSIGGGNTSNNIFDAYPRSIIVEYHFPGFDPNSEGMDWESLRLVFEESNGTWYLVGVVHDQWTI